MSTRVTCSGKEVAATKGYLVLDRAEMVADPAHSSLLDRAEVGADPAVEDPRLHVVAATGPSTLEQDPAPSQRDPAPRFILLSSALATRH